MKTSILRMITESDTRRPVPAIKPRVRPMATAKIWEMTAMSSEVRMPIMRRASKSRPSTSVPRGWA